MSKHPKSRSPESNNPSPPLVFTFDWRRTKPAQVDPDKWVDHLLRGLRDGRIDLDTVRNGIHEMLGAACAQALWNASQDGGFAGPDDRRYTINLVDGGRNDARNKRTRTALPPTQASEKRRYPRAWTNCQLAKVGVVPWSEDPTESLWLDCAECGQSWLPAFREDGKPARGYWKCPRGCNS